MITNETRDLQGNYIDPKLFIKEKQTDLPGFSIKDNWEQLTRHYGYYINTLSKRREEFRKNRSTVPSSG